MLAPGGRVVMLEPLLSHRCRRSRTGFHHERRRASAAMAFTETESPTCRSRRNLAQTTVAFFRQREALDRRWPELPLVEQALFSFFVYPLSGGFTRSGRFCPQPRTVRCQRARARCRAAARPARRFPLPRRPRADLGAWPAIRDRAGDRPERASRSSSRSSRSTAPIRRVGVAGWRNSNGSADLDLEAGVLEARAAARRPETRSRAGGRGGCGGGTRTFRSAHTCGFAMFGSAEREAAAGTQQREDVARSRRRGRRGGGR